MAMEARCYRGDEKRTRLKELKYELKDLAAFGVILTLLVITFYVPNIIPY
jgi:energy-coupling factor transport system permease protein